jgi:hypothetical protein
MRKCSRSVSGRRNSNSVLVLAKLDSAHGDLERVHVGLLATGKSEVDIRLRDVRNNRVSSQYGHPGISETAYRGKRSDSSPHTGSQEVQTDLEGSY